jgi:hypothetical protein
MSAARTVSCITGACAGTQLHEGIIPHVESTARHNHLLQQYRWYTAKATQPTSRLQDASVPDITRHSDRPRLCATAAKARATTACSSVSNAPGLSQAPICFSHLHLPQGPLHAECQALRSLQNAQKCALSQTGVTAEGRRPPNKAKDADSCHKRPKQASQQAKGSRERLLGQQTPNHPTEGCSCWSAGFPFVHSSRCCLRLPHRS